MTKTKNLARSVLFLAFLLFYMPVWAEEGADEALLAPEVVVTAIRSSEELLRLPYAIDIIKSDEIEKRSLLTANDVLLEKTTFNIARGGTPGTPSLFSLRGTDLSP